MDILKDFLRNVAHRSKAVGLDPMSVCQAAGVTPVMWEHWSDGRHSPSITNAQKILDKLTELEKRTP